MSQCRFKTSSGKQCTRIAKKGNYCWQHSEPKGIKCEHRVKPSKSVKNGTKDQKKIKDSLW